MSAKSELRAAWEDLIAWGLIVPTGEMRPGRNGEPEPVYVLREVAKAMGLPLPPLLTDVPPVND
jgi:hypothetical protein